MNRILLIFNSIDTQLSLPRFIPPKFPHIYSEEIYYENHTVRFYKDNYACYKNSTANVKLK